MAENEFNHVTSQGSSISSQRPSALLQDRTNIRFKTNFDRISQSRLPTEKVLLE